jgi:exodeoxyribonuclease V alpha subunit
MGSIPVRLTKSDREYIDKKGLDTIKSHAYDFISKRLAPAIIQNDGEQTPMKGHPVFKAQHACACCCRGCLNKWYKVPKDRELTPTQIDKIVNLLMAWIEREYYGQITNS